MHGWMQFMMCCCVRGGKVPAAPPPASSTSLTQFPALLVITHAPHTCPTRLASSGVPSVLPWSCTVPHNAQLRSLLGWSRASSATRSSPPRTQPCRACSAALARQVCKAGNGGAGQRRHQALAPVPPAAVPLWPGRVALGWPAVAGQLGCQPLPTRREAGRSWAGS
ncbi:hypothetical protein HaLaN_26165 [Haematococcus lacustris]|uniref:Uncharacterized protein n=1 Tax=Haematococcus lacustris TaxID=44745 RepID=A0A6A0A5L1_HAELA|nr:hypothetical protein HaLaN_26165 [Haematococcus lacustris]